MTLAWEHFATQRPYGNADRYLPRDVGSDPLVNYHWLDQEKAEIAHVVLVGSCAQGDGEPDDEVHTRDDEHTDASSCLTLYSSLWTAVHSSASCPPPRCWSPDLSA